MRSVFKAPMVGSIIIFFIGLIELILFGQSVLFSFIAVSIICTAGIGSLVWILIAAVLGTIILSLTKLTKSLIDPDEGNYYKIESGIALSRYVADSRQYGLSEKEIFNRLIDAGWSENEIKKALNK